MTWTWRIMSVVGVGLLWLVFTAPVRDFEEIPNDPVWLGQAVVSLPGLAYLFAALGASALVVAGWTGPRRRTCWVIAAAGVLAVVALWQIGADASVIWDGVDAQGRATGGYEEAGPAVGLLLGTIGGAVLVVGAPPGWFSAPAQDPAVGRRDRPRSAP